MRKRTAEQARLDSASEDRPPTSEKLKGKDASVVSTANRLSPKEFRSTYIEEAWMQYQPRDATSPFDIDLLFVDDLGKNDLEACYNIVETTSRTDYEASASGWHPRSKRNEMKHHDMRYLLVRRSCRQQPAADSPSDVAGFVSFMVTHDSTPAVPVLYIYEIHLSDSLRSVGLGTHLLRVAENIACNIGLSKLMLTCFLSNRSAFAFYKRHGYDVDVCSPVDRRTRKRLVKVDYVILSKSMDIDGEQV